MKLSAWFLAKAAQPSWLQRATVAAVVLILAASAVDKLFHYREFVNALRDYVLMPRGLASYFALPVIILELAIALGLLLSSLRRVAAGLGAATMLLFTGALLFNILYGNKGVCGCWFTFTLAEGNLPHVASNIMITGLFLTLALKDKNQCKAAAPPMASNQDKGE